MREPKPPKSFWLAYVVRVTVGNVAKALYRMSIRGAERIPAGGAILAGNHVSYADPVLLWCRSPRHVHFMARADLWEHFILGWGLDHFWGFPVKRGAADREALTRASALLQAGELVGIFPAGSRHAAEGESHGGAAFLAIRNGVPVVPIGIAGTDRIKPPGARLPRFPKVVVSVGEPIDPARFSQGGRKERVEAMTAEIMARISEQVDASKKVTGR
jgi:1-acyl-sn-glycerol-3-phosphate acyltransferase